MPGIGHITRSRFRRGVASIGAVALTAGLASCAAPAGSPQDSVTGGAAGATGAGRGLVIAMPSDLGGYSPLNGEGQYGQSLLYDGLLAMRSDGSEAPPELVPALAAEAPASDAGATTWTVKVRSGVSFSDGSPLTSADVKATFDAVLDPAKASEIRSYFDMIERVEAPDPETVVFRLRYPYAEFPSRLLLSIAPASKVSQGTAADQSLNTAPVGTGPYRLTELRPDRAVFDANPGYFGAPSGVGGPARVTHVLMPDDNSRAQRVQAGEIDGTVLPPRLAESVAGPGGFELRVAHTVDFRGIALPRTPFTEDVRVRKAINQAVDRQAVVDGILGGRGAVTSTPFPQSAGDAFEPTATFTYDVAAANAALDAAGWPVGSDGVRARQGQRATLPIMYNASDTVRGQVGTAFAADMRKIGVEVTLQGGTWDVIEKALPGSGYVQGGGSYPMSWDALAYDELHHRLPDASSPYNNPANFGSPESDAALDSARRELDPQKRAQLYRAAQRAYVEAPTAVFIAFAHHTYVQRSSAESGVKAPNSTSELVLEPHVHSSTWGPWWNLGRTEAAR